MSGWMVSPSQAEISGMLKMSECVKEYATATVKIHFPNKEVACRYCPLLETYSRNQCRRTGEYLLNINTIGYDCPLEFEENDNENISTTERE